MKKHFEMPDLKVTRFEDEEIMNETFASQVQTGTGEGGIGDSNTDDEW